VRNNLNQIYWRIKANNAILEEPATGQHSWIKKAFYDKSIKEVIGKAIGDCVAGQNEFSGKEDGGVITFKVDPTKQKYSKANWNAVVLYNLVEYVKRSVRYEGCQQNKTMYAIPNGFEKYKKVTFEQIRQDLTDYYTKLYQNNGLANEISELQDSIQSAINDITRYDQALQLELTLTKVMNVAYQYDCLDNRLWRIKALRELSARAKEWLDYGEKIILIAEGHLKKLEEFAEASLKKLEESSEEERAEKEKRTWSHLITECNRDTQNLHDLRQCYLDERKLSFNELVNTQQVLGRKDEELYRNNSISDDMITNMADELSKIIYTLNGFYNSREFSCVTIDYRYAKYCSKMDTCVEFTLEPLNIKSIPQPEDRRAEDLKQARTLHLAPELEEIRDDKYDSYLSFKQKIKSPFSAKPDYIQESKLMFCIDSFWHNSDYSLELEEIKTTIPVKPVIKGSNTEKLFEYNIDKNGPKYGILDNSTKNEVTYVARNIYQDIKFKVEDPILGDIVAMIKGLIDELQWEKEERERKAEKAGKIKRDSLELAEIPVK